MLMFVLSMLLFCQSTFGYPGGGKSGGGGVPVQPPGQRGKLPPGYASIHGEIMDISNKVVQRVTAAGSNYFSFSNQNGAPVFRRRERDRGSRFILFPDAKFPLGEGHFIVLRKMPGVMIPGVIPQPMYEVFRMSLGDSIHAYIQNYARAEPEVVNQGGYDGLTGANGAATSGFGAKTNARTKRKILGNEEKLADVVNLTPINFMDGIDDHK